MNTLTKICGLLILCSAIGVVVLGMAEVVDWRAANGPCACADGGECCCLPGECACDGCQCGEACGFDTFVRFFIDHIFPGEKCEAGPCCAR